MHAQVPNAATIDQVKSGMDDLVRGIDNTTRDIQQQIDFIRESESSHATDSLIAQLELSHDQLQMMRGYAADPAMHSALDNLGEHITTANSRVASLAVSRPGVPTVQPGVDQTAAAEAADEALVQHAMDAYVNPLLTEYRNLGQQMKFVAATPWDGPQGGALPPAPPGAPTGTPPGAPAGPNPGQPGGQNPGQPGGQKPALGSASPGGPGPGGPGGPGPGGPGGPGPGGPGPGGDTGMSAGPGPGPGGAPDLGTADTGSDPTSTNPVLAGGPTSTLTNPVSGTTDPTLGGITSPTGVGGLGTGTGGFGTGTGTGGLGTGTGGLGTISPGGPGKLVSEPIHLGGLGSAPGAGTGSTFTVPGVGRGGSLNPVGFSGGATSSGGLSPGTATPGTTEQPLSTGGIGTGVSSGLAGGPAVAGSAGAAGQGRMPYMPPMGGMGGMGAGAGGKPGMKPGTAEGSGAPELGASAPAKNPENVGVPSTLRGRKDADPRGGGGQRRRKKRPSPKPQPDDANPILDEHLWRVEPPQMSDG